MERTVLPHTHTTAPILDREAISEIDWENLRPAHNTVLTDGAVSHEASYLTSWDGKKLYWQIWEPKGERAAWRGRIALMHGYGEHSTRYAHVAQALVRAGYGVMAIDARGHGKSEGKPAHVGLFEEYVLDLERLCEAIEERWPEREGHGPLFVMGHSNGGLIALRHALRQPEGIAGFIVTSPFCGFKVRVAKWKSVAGNVLSKFVPTFSLPTDLPPEDLTRDSFVVAQYADDPLVRRAATARWFTEAKGAQQDLVERAGTITHPVIMHVAGDDRIADPEVAQRVYHALGSKDTTLHVHGTLFHEVLNEKEWKTILAEIVRWMEEIRATTTPEASTQGAR